MAHVLWGGVALFVAALLPFLYASRQALTVSAVLAGIGVGLFIDEVGKFLTSSNDYFYAPAAPIIYGVLLLLVLLWVLVRRRRPDRYDATWALIEATGDGLDGRLTASDRRRVLDGLRGVEPGVNADSDPDPIAAALVATLESPSMDERLGSEGWVASGDARRVLERILPTRVERWLVIASLMLAILSALLAAVALSAGSDLIAAELATAVEEAGRLEIPTEPIWVSMAFGIYVVVGIASAAALVLMARGRMWTGINLALLAVLTNLIAGGLVTFYAAQFTALSSTVTEVVVLGLVLDLRIRTGADDVDEAAG